MVPVARACHAQPADAGAHSCGDSRPGTGDDEADASLNRVRIADTRGAFAPAALGLGDPQVMAPHTLREALPSMIARLRWPMMAVGVDLPSVTLDTGQPIWESDDQVESEPDVVL